MSRTKKSQQDWLRTIYSTGDDARVCDTRLRPAGRDPNRKIFPRETDVRTAQRYGRLTVMHRSGPKWKVKCDCGETLELRAASLARGTKRSCGKYCPLPPLSNFIRGPEFGIWQGMIRRCEDETEPAFKNYGGRGVTVCREWRQSFDRFYKNMGPRPSERHSLDRIDNNGPYSPNNCRWATPKEQSRNKRTNVWVRVDGVEMIVADAAEYMGVSWPTARAKLRQIKKSSKSY